MLKKLYIYAFTLLSLAACSDDFNVPDRGIDDDGNLTVSFAIDPLKTVTTRADDALADVEMYVYHKTTGNQLQYASVPVNGTVGTVVLNADVKENKDNAVFYFVANKSSVTGSTASKTGIEAATTSNIATDNHLTLSSQGVSYSALAGSQSNQVKLIHNGAKVTVSVANGENYSKDLTHYNFSTAQTAGSSLLLAGGLHSATNPALSSASKLTDAQIDGLSLSAEKYVHPTSNAGTDVAFVIAKIPYGNTEFFYRLDFIEKDEANKTTKPIHIEPNHWYQFLIKGVTGAGYATASEAAKNPTPMVDYDIHDHAPRIYNMISDGSRELGVGYDVNNYNVAPETESAPNRFTFLLKLYSPTATEMTEITNSNLSKYFFIPEDCDWLEVVSISPADNMEYGQDGYDDTGKPGADKDSKGKIYQVELKFKKTNVPGTVETDVEVSWHGLSRSVHVKWIKDFDASLLFSPDVNIKAFKHNGHRWNDNSEWNDGKAYKYFTDFLGTQNEEGAFSAGTKADANNGEDRQGGLHFPLMYGETHEAWTYMYEVTLNEQVGDNNDFTWSVEAEGVSNVRITTDDGVTPKTSGNQSDRKFYVTRTNNMTDGKYDDWNYEVGKLNITVTVKDGKPVTYPIDLYHTGFFHKDNNYDDCIKGSVNTKYLYYEVVSAGKDHWLDRNIGATSCGMYIEGAMGSKSAAGYYLVGAQYDAYKTPVMFTKILPPGYQFPSVEQWDDMRLKSEFNTNQSGAYYNAYYQTTAGVSETNPIGKRLYFPKMRYYEGKDASGLVGIDRAGYYWTRDAGTGLEKEEIGNWLKALTISGTATSYVNARVKGHGNAYYMSARAVATRNTTTTVNRFEFQVIGATHVYLYTIDENGERTPLNSWPGQAIGSYSTMGPGMAFPFAYETKVATASNLYVVFNYVGKKGTIYTMSNDVYANDAAHTTKNGDTAHGWLVYGANKSTEFSKSGSGVTIDNSQSQRGTVWTCSPKWDTDNVYFFRLYWPKSWNKKYIHLWLENVGYGAITKEGAATPVESDIEGWVCVDFTLTSDKLDKTIGYKFKNSDDTETVKSMGASVRTKFGADATKLNTAYIDQTNDGNTIKGVPSEIITYFGFRIAWQQSLGDEVKVKDDTTGEWLIGGENSFQKVTDTGYWDSNTLYYVDKSNLRDSYKGHSITIYFRNGSVVRKKSAVSLSDWSKGNPYKIWASDVDKLPFTIGQNIRIKWVDSKQKNKIYAWYADKSEIFGSWNGTNNTPVQSGGYYYKDFTITKDCTSVNFILHQDGGSNQTDDLSFDFSVCVYDSSLNKYVYTVPESLF